MALSPDLISQFVNITNDTKEKNTDVTLHGVVKKDGNNIYVKLDGSNEYTPCNTTAEVEDGERVSARINNHSLTIDGNFNSPATRIDTVRDMSRNLNNRLVQQYTNITSDSSAIMLEALEKYVVTNDFEEYQRTIESLIEQRANGITISLTNTINNLKDENSGLTDRIQSFEKYFTFTENGIGIKDIRGENTAELRIDTGIISFMKNGTQYGWWDGVDFHTGNLIVDVNERAQFGNFAFVPRSDGSLSFLKVSD